MIQQTVKNVLLVVTLILSFSYVEASENSAAASATKKMRQDINESLDKIETQISDLEIKSKDMTAQAKAEWQSTMSDLKKHRDELKTKLSEEKSETTAKAKEYWSRMKAAVAELQQGVNAASEKIKGKTK